MDRLLPPWKLMAVSLNMKLWSEIQNLPMPPAFVKCLFQTCGSADSLVRGQFRPAFDSEAENPFWFLLSAYHRLWQTEKPAFMVSRSIKCSSFYWVLIQTPHRQIFLLEHIKCKQGFIWMSMFFYRNLTRNQNQAQYSRIMKIHVGSQWSFSKKFLIKY